MAVPAAHADALSRLKTTGRDLVAIVSVASAEALRRSPGPGEWSARTVLTHLADAELVYGARLRLVVAEQNPPLPAFDENAWSSRFGDLEDAKEALERWRVNRTSTIRVFDSLAEEEWERAGMHEQRGRLTAGDICRLLADHDTSHLNQIRTAVAT